MGVVAVRYSEGFDRYERLGGTDIWPEYNLHGHVLNLYWDRLYEVFPEYQFVLYDQEADEVLAEGHTVRSSGTVRPRALAPVSTPASRPASSCRPPAGARRRCAPWRRHLNILSGR